MFENVLNISATLNKQDFYAKLLRFYYLNVQFDIKTENNFIFECDYFSAHGFEWIVHVCGE